MALMATAPGPLIGVIIFLALIGTRRVGNSRLATAALISVVFVEIVREQGQVVMAYTAGWLWLPLRDNYLIDFSITLLCLHGLRELGALIGRRVQAGLFVRAARMRDAIAVALAALIAASAGDIRYHPQELLRPAPLGYPFYRGEPDLQPIFASIARLPQSRVYLLEYDRFGFTRGFGDALFAKVGEVTLYASLAEQNYKEWAVFQDLGIRPEADWGGYPGGYTPRTIRTLPPRNSLGRDNDTGYYRHSVIVQPPLRADMLRLLGVTHILAVRTIGTEPDLIYPMGAPNTDRDLAALRFTETKSIEYKSSIDSTAHHTLFTLAVPLPRAFVLAGADRKAQQALEHELSPQIEGQQIAFAGYHFAIQPARIEHYERESVIVHANLPEDGMLVLGDLYHPFWHVEVDGRPAAITPAFDIMRAVALPAGEHEVAFRYRVPRLRAAVITSLAALATLLALCIWDRRRSGF
jgi:hypothetical protein